MKTGNKSLCIHGGNGPESALVNSSWLNGFLRMGRSRNPSLKIAHEN